MSDKRVVRTLKRARRLLDHSKWVKRAYARNATGTALHPLHLEAVGFCAVGAICRVVNDDEDSAYDAEVALDKAVEQTFENIVKERHEGTISKTPTTWFNDVKAEKKKEVLAMFDKAIELAEGE